MPYVNYDGAELYYEVTGQGPGLVFVHGLGLAAEFFAPQVSAFSHAYRVVTFDLRGHGRSTSGPKPHSVELYAADLQAVIKAALPAGEPFAIVGFSLGVMVVLSWLNAGQRPCQAVCLIGGVPMASAGAKALFRRRATEARLVGLGTIAHQVVHGSIGQAARRDQPGLVGLIRYMIARNHPDAYVQACRALVSADTRDAMAHVARPVLLISGDEDFYANPDSQKQMVSILPRAEWHLVAGAGHMVSLERPADVNGRLAAFLATHRPGTPTGL